MNAWHRWLAGQFARPHGSPGRWLLGPILNQTGQPMMDAAFDALAPVPGDHVLDLGFGGGALSRSIVDTGAKVTGIDRSEAMVARARSRMAGPVADGRARFLVGDAQALPLPDAAVNKAASVNTLYFWPDLAPVFRELHRVLMPGGQLLLCFQTAASVRAWPGHVHGFYAHDTDTVELAIAAAGFSNLQAKAGQGRHVGDFCCLSALRSTP